MEREMPEPQEMPTNLPPNYDPERADRIRELGRQLIAASDPAEIERLEKELYTFIIGQPIALNAAS
jgi:hypothetical protein